MAHSTETSGSEVSPSMKDTGSKALLSVIVPVYNVEPFLARALESLCSQSYTNLEIICINDGSADNSLAILREYEAKDKRIRVISQPNSGVAAARNAGLNAATGDWVTAVDPDDYLMPGAYSTVMPHATDEVDLVVFGAHVEAEPEPELQKRVAGLHYWANARHVGLKKLDTYCFPAGGWYLWNKLYRRSLIEEHGLRFDTSICIAEDLCFHMRYCAYARNAYFCPEELYVYFLRGSSIVNTFDKAGQRKESYLRAVNNILAVYEEQGLTEAFSPFFEWFIRDESTNINKWSYLTSCPLSGRRQLLDILLRYCLQENDRLAPVLHELSEQLRRAQWITGQLPDCIPPTATEPQGSDYMNVAIPVQEAHAGRAALTALGLRQTTAAGQNICLHFICDELSAYTRTTLEALTGDGLSVQLHHMPAAQLHRLPPLSREFPYEGYMKMLLPALLPDTERVLLLSAGLLLKGALPPIDRVEMGDMPVAVLPDFPVEERQAAARNIRVDNYVSSAALLMNLGRMRELNRSEAWAAATVLTSHSYPQAETGAFNLVFRERMATLPAPWAELIHPANEEELMLAACEPAARNIGIPLNIAQMRAELCPPPTVPRNTTVHAAEPRQEPRIADIALRYPQLRRRYRYYRLMSMLTWGRRRKNYKHKTRAYRSLLRRIRRFFRDTQQQWEHLLKKEQNS